MSASACIKILAAAALLATATLSGCVVAPAPGYYDGGVVTIALPAPRVEVIGVAPTPGYLWFPGYWNWSGGAHVWVGGHWGAGRPGYAWAPHTWVRHGGGWRMAPGHWVHR